MLLLSIKLQKLVVPSVAVSCCLLSYLVDDLRLHNRLIETEELNFISVVNVVRDYMY